MEDRSLPERPLLERLARHLAASTPNQWPDHVEHAATILALIKEPDGAMRAAGDATQWGLMIDAALRDRWSLPHGSDHASAESANDGADEEGEIRLPPQAVGHDRADWIHLHHGEEKPS
ncbi:hypothetical protein [Sphingobium sp.]|uniref:hypothetical protein n=1 Tax=Sphingobium sp. TaxID=1912891 RepID=UPI0026168B82|nr:hypothetical protein [Sphingobium sp.]